MKTDRKILQKGILYMSIAMPLLFLGPVVIHSAFKNPNHPYYFAVLGFGIITCLSAMMMVFLGLRKITNSLFKKK
ncbi:DUF6095 family protein [Flavobacterium macacae]|uniref:Uncharacterized protein n=1 Tax=Flavobacterium macacae TaxID=2488993 RepID=A0A3P3WAM3_9FLAO|nr:DUF6095 family protein [Flavobacterium macacae]RRJ91407.1 hypothetical protein EG849_08415 [Flavobacterium macacae]